MFPEELKNKAEHLVALFEEVEKIKVDQKSIYSYLKNVYLPDTFGTPLPKPKRDTIIMRVTIDLQAELEILEQKVRSDKKKEGQHLP